MNKPRRPAFLLVMARALTLAPTVSFAATLPCKHKNTEPGDHSEPDCGVPGH